MKVRKFNEGIELDHRIVVSKIKSGLDTIGLRPILYFHPNELEGELKQEYDSLDFHIGDYVKRISYTDTNYIFQIDMIELKYSGDLRYRLNLIGEFNNGRVSKYRQSDYTWCNDYSITLVPEYEIDADKYNL